jgi:hypothetical protein
MNEDEIAGPAVLLMPDRQFVVRYSLKLSARTSA